MIHFSDPLTWTMAHYALLKPAWLAQFGSLYSLNSIVKLITWTQLVFFLPSVALQAALQYFTLFYTFHHFFTVWHCCRGLHAASPLSLPQVVLPQGQWPVHGNFKFNTNTHAWEYIHIYSCTYHIIGKNGKNGNQYLSDCQITIINWYMILYEPRCSSWTRMLTRLPKSLHPSWKEQFCEWHSQKECPPVRHSLSDSHVTALICYSGPDFSWKTRPVWHFGSNTLDVSRVSTYTPFLFSGVPLLALHCLKMFEDPLSDFSDTLGISCHTIDWLWHSRSDTLENL